MEDINGIPLRWNVDEDRELLGRLLPGGVDSNYFQSIQAPVVNTSSQFTDSPFGEGSIFSQEDHGYIEYINFQTLLTDIANKRNVGILYNYEKYESNRSIPVRNYLKLPVDVKKIEERINDAAKKYWGIKLPELPPLNPVKKVDEPYIDKVTGKILNLKGKLNIRQGNLPLDTNHIGTHFTFDLEKEEIEFADYFFYLEDQGKFDNSNIAIIIYTNDYKAYAALSDIIGFYLSQEAKDWINNKFQKAFTEARKNQSHLAWLYTCAPDFVLETLTDEMLWNDFNVLANGRINAFGVNKYQAIIILLSVAKNYKWWFDGINKNPSSMRKVLEKFTNYYIPSLLFVCVKIGAGAWTEKDYEKAPRFNINEIKIVNSLNQDMMA